MKIIVGEPKVNQFISIVDHWGADYMSHNHFHNILRRFDVLPTFLFTKSETMRDYYLQIWYIRVASRVVEWFQAKNLRKLGNIRKVSKQRSYSLVPSFPAKTKILLILHKKLLKNRNETFSVVGYFSWKLEFSNILQIIACLKPRRSKNELNLKIYFSLYDEKLYLVNKRTEIGP